MDKLTPYSNSTLPPGPSNQGLSQERPEHDPRLLGISQVDKLNKRLRARNQQNNLQNSLAVPSNMLAPLTQRSFSPPS